VSFVLERGRTLGIVGESGSGKSVTLMSIVRLLATPAGRIENGEVLFEGKNLVTSSETEMRHIRGSKISVITQDPMTSLNPVYTIGNQLEEPIRQHQRIRVRDTLRRLAVGALQSVGIPAPEDRVSSYPHQMSGGQRQRVVTAMALACRPSLILCDEPTTALDVTVQLQILKLLRDLQKEHGMAMIMVSHDLSVIARVCDDVAVMYAGRIVEKASVSRLFEKPAHPYTRALMRSLNAETDASGRLYAIEGQPPNVRNIGNGCPFAPRCQSVRSECREHFPHEIALSPGHTTSCWAVMEEAGITAPVRKSV